MARVAGQRFPPPAGHPERAEGPLLGQQRQEDRLPHLLPGGAAQTEGEEDLRGLPLHPLPVPRQRWGQTGDAQGRQDQTFRPHCGRVTCN